MRKDHFYNNLLYVVDGELLNHMVKIMDKFQQIRPEHKKVLNYMKKVLFNVVIILQVRLRMNGMKLN